ncbi:Plasmodium exported protein, unknown function [Plasmodium vivax]|nr:Plasmodium exported protein, unknown function [Plasmodium vivax]
MFRANDGSGGSTHFLGPRLEGVHSLPPGIPNTFDLFTKYKIFAPFIIFYFTMMYLLSVVRKTCTRFLHKGHYSPKKLCMSPMKSLLHMRNDEKGATNGWYPYEDTYRSQHFNNDEEMSVSEFKGKEKEKSLHVSKKSEKKGPLLYGLLDDQHRTNLRLKYGQLYKGINQFNDKRNTHLGEEDDEEEDSDDESEIDLEDDYYDDDYYDSFDYDDGEDNDSESYKERNRKMRKRVKKAIKKEVTKEVKKEVTKEVKMEVKNELKEIFKNEMKKKLLDELIKELKLEQMDTAKEGGENAQLTFNQQILQAILRDEISKRAQANNHLINPNAPKDLWQLNLELIEAENKHKKKKIEEQQVATLLRQAQEEINQLQKQIENVKHKRNIYVHPNEEYKQLLFLYPQNKMFQEKEKIGLVRELQKKYQIKAEQKQKLLEQMQKVQNELQLAGDEVEVLRASVKAKEEEEKYKGKANQPLGQHARVEARAEPKAEAHLPNVPHLSHLPKQPQQPQLPPAPSLASLPAQWKGTAVPAWAERSPLPVKIKMLSDVQQKLEMMESKLHPEGEKIEQKVNYVY